MSAARPRPTRRAIAQPALRVIAEAGWITVVYAAAAVMISRQAPVLGPLEFVVFVLAGALIGRLGRPRPDIGPVLLIAGVVFGGALGWLGSGEARSLLPNLPAAADVHLAGWLAGVAVLRGALIDTGRRAAEELERVLRTVPVGLALIWAYVQLASPPGLWISFAVAALWGTVAFLAAAAVSMGLARLKVLHAGVPDEGHRRGWRWLVTVIGLAIVPIALPVGVLSGIPVATLLNPVTGPLQMLLGLLTIPLAAIVFVLSEILRPFGGPLGELMDEIQRRMEQRPPPAPETPSDFGTIVGLAIWALTLFLVLLAVFHVARWLLNRRVVLSPELEKADADTEVSIVVPASQRRPATPARVRRGGAHDVVTAYLAALAELEAHSELARLPSETPAQHAARLRVAGVPGASELARLAAGYQLARYGERRITGFENRRAAGRVQRLRRLLRSSAKRDALSKEIAPA